MFIFCVKVCSDFLGNCHVILESSVFPTACRFLSFWSRNLRSCWQKQRFGWAWARKTATDFSLEETQKKHVFNTYAFPSTMGDGSWKLNHGPLPFWYFHGDTHARFHVFCGNTSQNVEIFGHHMYRCGNTSLTHTRLQSLFVSLWETHTYLLVLVVKSRKMRLSLVSSLINNRKHVRVPRQPSLIFS